MFGNSFIGEFKEAAILDKPNTLHSEGTGVY